MRTFNARAEIIKYGRPFATQSGRYEILFTPHMLGSMVEVRTKSKDDACGTYLLADCPPIFILALGGAARTLNTSTKGSR